MQEGIIIESQKAINFELFCVRCGRKTNRRLYYDSVPGLSFLIEFLLGFMGSLILLFVDKGRPWIPFCIRCQWRYALPSRKGVFYVVLAIVLIALSVYLLVIQRFILGIFAIVCEFIALYMGDRLSKNRRDEAMPFYVEIHQDKITYTFIDGDFYDKQMHALNQEGITSSVR